MNDDATPEPPRSAPGSTSGTSGAPGPSGNRWEPPAGAPGTTPYAAGPGRPGWRDRVRPDRLGPQARTGVAAGVAALVVAGLGGFAIGHATADGGSDGHGFGQRFDDHDHGGFPPQDGIQGQPGQPGGSNGGSTDGSTDDLPGQTGSST